jgi:hypothetical protein
MKEMSPKLKALLENLRENLEKKQTLLKIKEELKQHRQLLEKRETEQKN